MSFIVTLIGSVSFPETESTSHVDTVAHKQGTALSLIICTCMVHTRIQ